MQKDYVKHRLYPIYVNEQNYRLLFLILQFICGFYTSHTNVEVRFYSLNVEVR